MFRQLTVQFTRFASTLRALGYDQRGATSTEYGILLSFLALATTTLKTALGIP